MPVLLQRNAPRSDAVAVKICGLRDAAQVDGAVAAGARFLGFNFFARSPRSVTFQGARDLAARMPVGVARVGLVVDPDDAFLDDLGACVPLDIVQLHGDESPARVREVKARTGLPVMKAVGLAGPDDLPRIAQYAQVADMVLIDAKPPEGAALPGGNGLRFDWRLLEGRDWSCPWMLAGGLTPGNVGEAIRRTGARIVDVASGVETAPAVKDDGLMRAFVAAAHA